MVIINIYFLLFMQHAVTLGNSTVFQKDLAFPFLMAVVSWPQLSAKLSPSLSLTGPPPAGEGTAQEEQRWLPGPFPGGHPYNPSQQNLPVYTQCNGSETN